MVSSAKILFQCAAKDALSDGSSAVKAAMQFASASNWCSKKTGRSPSVTSRSRTVPSEAPPSASAYDHLTLSQVSPATLR